MCTLNNDYNFIQAVIDFFITSIYCPNRRIRCMHIAIMIIRKNGSYLCILQSSQQFIQPAWSRSPDSMLALRQALAEGGFSARDGKGGVGVCLMVWRGGEEEDEWRDSRGGRICCHVVLRC